jgi:hypothetical protein
MASSVASAREMERWAKERKEAVQHSVPVSLTAKQNFKSFQPDLEQLAKFEDKVQQLAERQEAKESELEVVPIINVMGSTAGAGSGEFHTYRGYRAKEMARLEGFEREKKLEVAQRQWEQERDEAAAAVEAKHAKSAAKRNQKKEKRKAAVQAEKEQRKAARTEGSSSADAPPADASAGAGASAGADAGEEDEEE